MSSSIRVLFAGTPNFAARHLKALLADQRFELCGVLTQPDRPAGRGQRMQASEVKVLAENHHLPVEQPTTLKDVPLDWIKDYHADVLVVVAYGMILPQKLLSIPPLGCINVHASVLPCWRGAAPIERAIAAGDRSSGISIIQMDAGLDTGDVLYHQSCAIELFDTGDSLRTKLAELGCQTLPDVLVQHSEGKLTGQPQANDQSSYAPRIKKSESQIDWSADASTIERKIRAFYSASPCYTHLQQKRMRIIHAEVLTENAAKPGEIIEVSPQGLHVACGKNALRLLRIQLSGKKEQDIAPLIRSGFSHFQSGQCFA